jgi:hypothetical protein
VAFALIAAVASGFFREELEDQPSNVKSLAGALSFFSVGLCAWGCIRRRDTGTRLAAWPASTFLTTIV